MISVIVPVFNTERELPRCLQSIVEQTYEDLEILCIDDGSTDRSGIIADEFAKKDNRLKVIHKENGGESSARNIGLKMASGEYIAFCDCDDWLDKDMYEILVRMLESEKVDLVAGSWYQENDGYSREIKNAIQADDHVFGRDELLKYLYMRDSYRGFAYMWNKLYKSEILYDKKGRQILFDETMQIGADVLYLAEAALNVRRAKYIDRAFYHYYQRKDSGCRTKDPVRLRDWLRAYEIVIQRFYDEQIEEEILSYVKRFLAYHSSNAAEIALHEGNQQAKEEFQKIMRQYEQEYVVLNAQYPQRIQRYMDLLKQ
ncbi:MAG: glycosyltransferase [Eubacterium sp.]|nr:glycosyltransferase [Eubacterium sp.]